MNTYLGVEPQELQFSFVLRNQNACTITLTNSGTMNMAFKILTTNPKKYSVLPPIGIVFPQMTCKVIVTMQAQNKMPRDMECKDKFMVRSILVNARVTLQDITLDMFKNHRVEECKLGVIYSFPTQNSSPITQVLETRVFLEVEPLNLRFPYELHKKASCSVQLSNISNEYIGFQVSTFDQKKYSIQPTIGIIMPQSKYNVEVIMQPQEEYPPHMKINDIFTIQSVITFPSATIDDIFRAMLMNSRKYEYNVEEIKLSVDYFIPYIPPSLVSRTSKEDSPMIVYHAMSYHTVIKCFVCPDLFITEDINVCQFGIGLLEILTGFLPEHNGKIISREVNLDHDTGDKFSKFSIHRGCSPIECAEKCMDLALWCCEYKPRNRPSIVDVKLEINGIFPPSTVDWKTELDYVLYDTSDDDDVNPTVDVVSEQKDILPEPTMDWETWLKVNQPVEYPVREQEIILPKMQDVQPQEVNQESYPKGDHVHTTTFISKILNASQRRNVARFVLGITIGLLVMIFWNSITKKISESFEDWVFRALLFVLLPFVSKYAGDKVYEFIKFVILGGELKEENSDPPQIKAAQ